MIDEFRALTQRVIAAEKPGFWSDWTQEQQELYTSGDWEMFSRSRGYSEEEISDCREWLRLIKEDNSRLLPVKDLVFQAAIENIKRDARGEILRSSKMEGLRCLL